MVDVMDATTVANESIQSKAEKETAYQAEFEAAIAFVGFAPSQFTHSKQAYQLLVE